MASYVYHCCCGDHDGSGNCDCPDCPANSEGGLDESSDSSSFRRCGGEAHYGIPGLALDAFVVPSAQRNDTGTQLRPIIAVNELEPGPAVEPPLRPPRI